MATDERTDREIRLDDEHQYEQAVAVAGNGSAIGALVTGVLSLTLSLLIVPAIGGVLLGIISVPLGIAGVRRANELGGMNHGVAWSGLVSGVLGLLLGLAVVIGGIALFQSGDFQQQMNEMQQQMNQLQQQTNVG